MKTLTQQIVQPTTHYTPMPGKKFEYARGFDSTTLMPVQRDEHYEPMPMKQAQYDIMPMK